MNIIIKVKNFIEENSLILPQDKIVVAFSGGPDSTFLLYFLKENYNNPIILVHLNHLLRGEDSDLDEIFIRKVSQKLKIPLFVRRLNIKKLSEERKKSIEEVGREERFKFFNEILKRENFTKIALAHNFDDNIESILMNFIRGTGLKGLQGILPKWGNIIHPILIVKREEIMKYLKEKNLQFRVDKTNLESIYLRNKIRNELIPYIEKEYNKSFKEKLFDLSEIVKYDEELLNEITQDKIKEVLKKFDDCFSIEIKNFKNLHKSIQRRIIREIINNIGEDLREFSVKNIDDVINLINKKSGKEIILSKELIARREKDVIIIEKISTNFKDYLIEINELGEVKKDGLKITLKLIDKMEKVNNPFEAYFDFDKISFPLYIRPPKFGEKFTPLGLKFSKKLQDFLTDLKVPKSVKWKIPILSDSKSDILWIIGLRINENYKVSEMTKRVLYITIELEDNEWIKIYKRFL
ncbi:MAG: tRNA lysidine(34) synthetase TilS [Caldisericia bacterium]|nr:tRNA lysidine(34) synthetase TilS [Caldisericia bacterium]